MAQKTSTKQQQWNLASLALTDAYMDFILSRQAMNVTPNTMEFYRYTAGAFLQWIEQWNISCTEEITARHVRQYLAGLLDRGKKHHPARPRPSDPDPAWVLVRGKVHSGAGHLRHAETGKEAFDGPHPEQLQVILKACNTRDKAMILFMADGGLRRSEICALNWDDVDMQTGLVRVRQEKVKRTVAQ